jgi:2-aminoethylphosphonate-pyruvate transaminase
MAQIAARLGISCVEVASPETEPPDLPRIARTLKEDTGITHVAMVHCETTTGMLNPAAEVGRIVAQARRIYILDAMSSFGGVSMSIDDVGAQYLISSANKCVQGVPGFGFVIAEQAELVRCEGYARSLSLDLYDQWHEMESKGGKWRYTSPTHVVRAFSQALDELDAEGGVAVRAARYAENQRLLVDGMQRIGFHTLLPREHQSTIITSFLCPPDSRFDFAEFYDRLKARRYVIYPGKVTSAETFRIGTIGHVFPADVEELVQTVGEVAAAMEIEFE